MGAWISEWNACQDYRFVWNIIEIIMKIINFSLIFKVLYMNPLDLGIKQWLNQNRESNSLNTRQVVNRKIIS